MILITILSELIQAQTTGMKDVSHVLMDCNEGKGPLGTACLVCDSGNIEVVYHSSDLKSFRSRRTLSRSRGREKTQNYSLLFIYLKWQRTSFFTTWHVKSALAVALNYSLSVVSYLFFMQCTVRWKSEVTIAEHSLHTHTHTHMHTFLGERILVYITLHSQGHSHECMHALTCTITRIHSFVSHSVLPSPSRTAFTSDCQLFGSEPSLITRILHPVSPLWHRDLFALLSIWKLSCRKSSLFQSTTLRKIIIKPELRSLRMYAEKMKRYNKNCRGLFPWVQMML